MSKARSFGPVAKRSSRSTTVRSEVAWRRPRPSATHTD